MHDNLQPNLIALQVVLIVATTIAVVLRCIAIWKLPYHKFGLDDACAIAALPFIIAETGLILWWVDLGLGRPARYSSEANLEKAPLIMWVAELLYDTAISLPKFSALFFYMRVFRNPGNYRTFRRAIYATIALVGAWLVSAYLTTIFECTPVRSAFDVHVKGKCFNIWGWILGFAVGSTFLDLIIMLLPMPMLWGLQASWKKRIQVIIVFFFGYCVVAVSVGKLVTIAKAGPAILSDVTWTTVTYLMWVQLEAPVSVISVSIPVIYSYFKWLYGQRTGTSVSMSYSSDKPVTKSSSGRRATISRYFNAKRLTQHDSAPQTPTTTYPSENRDNGRDAYSMDHPSDHDSERIPEVFPTEVVQSSSGRNSYQ